MEAEAGGMRRGIGLSQLEKAGKWLPLGASRRNTALPFYTFILIAISHCRSPGLKGTNVCCFEPLQLGAIS